MNEINAGCMENYAFIKSEGHTEGQGVEGLLNIQATCCRRGKHHLLINDEFGIICKYCSYVEMEIQHILPPLLNSPSAFMPFEQFVNNAKGKKIALFLDCDGKLSPIVDNPLF